MNNLLAEHFDSICKKNWNDNALIIDGKKFKFSELYNYSNIIACILKTKIKKNDTVAIYAEKDIKVFASIIACIKSGNPYSIIDINSPIKRIDMMFKTLKPKLNLYNLKNNISKKIPSINLNKINLVKKKSQVEYAKTIPSCPIYIMFTSGSTGVPKGVAISSQNILNFINWAKNTYNIKSGVIQSNLNPLHFDNSIFDIYGGLFNGSTLVTFKQKDLLDPSKILKVFLKEKINIWFSVPSLIIFFMKFGFFEKKKFLNLKKIIFGGEGFPKNKLLELFKIMNKNIDLINVYGPTECTCICSSYKITNNDFLKNEKKRYAPFGSKLSDYFYFYIVKEKSNGRLVLSNRGELLIGGPNVGLGYYNNSSETDKKFIQNPFNNKYTDIVYRSGDLVYKDKRNDKIYFSSRIDDQIKFQGYRIELLEIEQAIGQIKGLEENCVLLSKINSNPKIISFIVTNLNLERIKNELKKSLPKYMIPSEFLYVSKLEKNNNGKIDRIKTFKKNYGKRNQKNPN